MAALTGINVPASIVPFTTDDTYPTHDAEYGKGGYRSVATTTDRDSISTDHRVSGMAVYCRDVDLLYILQDDLTTWAEFTTVGTTYTASNGVTLSGTDIQHDDTSSVVDLTSSSRTYVTGLTFDTYGHVTAYTTGTETVTSSNKTAITVACSDESTALTTGVKVTTRAPYAITLTEVRASLTTAQTSGSVVTVDIKVGGSTILSTLITIDNGETTSKTAATPAVISTSSIADDAVIEVEITQVGDGTAAGLKVHLIGTYT